MIIGIIKNLFFVINKKQKIYFFFVQALIFLSSLMEILTVFMIGGLISFLSDNSSNEKNFFLEKFLNFLEIKSIYTYASILVTVLIITSILSIFSNWYIP